MKLFSKTLLSTAVLSCFSLPSHADIYTMGIEYCKNNLGGCGLEEVAEFAFDDKKCDNPTKEPFTTLCRNFKAKLDAYRPQAGDVVQRNDVKKDISMCMNSTNTSDTYCVGIQEAVKNSIKGKYLEITAVEKCIQDGETTCKQPVVNKVNDCVNSTDTTNNYCNDIKAKITPKYTLTTSCGTSSSSAPSSCSNTDIQNKVKKCIGLTNETPSIFDNKHSENSECNALRDGVINQKYIWKDNAKSYAFLASTNPGDDALFIPSIDSGALTLENSPLTPIDFNNRKQNRIPFKWVLKSDSKCGTVIGLVDGDKPKVSNIKCDLD